MKQNAKNFVPVSYASRALKGAERKYGMSDLETLAVVWAFKTFRLLIKGTHFRVVTNHNALKAFVKKASLEGNLLYWADFLMVYNMEINYSQGKENIVD